MEKMVYDQSEYCYMTYPLCFITKKTLKVKKIFDSADYFLKLYQTNKKNNENNISDIICFLNINMKEPLPEKAWAYIFKLIEEDDLLESILISLNKIFSISSKSTNMFS